MRRLDIKRRLDSDDIRAVGELLTVAEQAAGHRAVDDHRWLDMAEGGPGAFAGVLAWEPGHGHPVGYAQVTRARNSWALDLVIHPHHRHHALDIGREVLGAALDTIGEEGGGPVHLWVSRPTATHDAVATAVGLQPGRDLLQMRRSLPVEGVEAPAIAVRPFRPDDADAWLEVNNRSFEEHPEQGGWDRATLAAQQAQPWFDPEGFLLHERDGRLAGFCWTKVHDDEDPPVGEIYVIAVDPHFHGLGLGRALVLAGLDHLAGKGLRRAMLYVDAANAAAVALYGGLGFTIDHVDRAYVGVLPPAEEGQNAP